MATLKDVKNKIGAVQKTKQITKAMNMVAASRLREAQLKMEQFRPYAQKFAEVLSSLSERSEDTSNPLLVPKSEVKNINIILCTSDRGLCGGFNVNLIEKAETCLNEKGVDGVNISFTNFGKKGRDWARKSKLTISDEHIGIIGAKFGFEIASAVRQKLVNDFLADKIDEVYLVYPQFISVGKQIPYLQKLLPIPALEKVESDQESQSDEYLPEHICEPSPEALLADMLPRNISVQIHSALLETSASEHAARMTAMDNATNACNDMIDNLTLAYNKARQAAITAELMDIVGGAEALKG